MFHNHILNPNLNLIHPAFCTPREHEILITAPQLGIVRINDLEIAPASSILRLLI